MTMTDHRDGEDLDQIIEQFRTAAKVERGSLLDLQFGMLTVRLRSYALGVVRRAVDNLIERAAFLVANAGDAKPNSHGRRAAIVRMIEAMEPTLCDWPAGLEGHVLTHHLSDEGEKSLAVLVDASPAADWEKPIKVRLLEDFYCLEAGDEFETHRFLFVPLPLDPEE
jgi:hypothetical protein